MEVFYSAEAPKNVIVNGARRTLNYDVHELSDEEIKALYDASSDKESGMLYEYFAKEHRYSYRTLTIGGGRYNYKGIVEAIIREKYGADEMEAITNNMNAVVSEFFNVLVSEGILKATKYLVENIDASNTENFKQMQEWRNMAKTEAKSILGL